jgi:hypothetical protein
MIGTLLADAGRSSAAEPSPLAEMDIRMGDGEAGYRRCGLFVRAESINLQNLGELLRICAALAGDKLSAPFAPTEIPP